MGELLQLTGFKSLNCFRLSLLVKGMPDVFVEWYWYLTHHKLFTGIDTHTGADLLFPNFLSSEQQFLQPYVGLEINQPAGHSEVV